MSRDERSCARFEAEDVVWFDFYALCDGPRSQNDYIELAKEYHAVLISGCPSARRLRVDDQARRFINLVDEFYDRNVKLIISREVAVCTRYTQAGDWVLSLIALSAGCWKCKVMTTLAYLTGPSVSCLGADG